MTKLLGNKFTRIILWLIVIVAIVTAIILYWRHAEMYPSTDDAYVQANIVHIAPEVSGPVDQIYVKNYQNVKQGELLFTIDPRPFQIAVENAKAKLQLAQQQMSADQATVDQAESSIQANESQLVLAEQNANRMLKLVKDGQISQQEGDKIRNALKVARANLASSKQQLKQAQATLGQDGPNNANVQAAKADLASAELNLSYTKIYAPESGQLVDFELRPGNMLTANQQVFNIVEKNSWWVATNFKETQLERIKPGQTANVVLDMYPDHTFKGTVLELSPGSGSAFSILPPENASGNWVKVTQRFPVRVEISEPEHTDFPLRVGASATVTIDTTQ